MKLPPLPPLFHRSPQETWSPRQKTGFWAWNGGWALASGVGVALLSLLLAVGSYSLRRFFLGYFQDPLLLALNVLPVLALLLLFYGVTGRSHWAFLITAAIVLGFSVGNYYKLMFRDDPLMFTDLLLLKEAGNMAGKYSLFLNWKLVLTILCVLGGFLFLRVLVQGRLKWQARVACAVAGALSIALLCPALLSARTYANTTHYDRMENRWSATQQYISHGFVYPFLHSIGDAIETPPEGYDPSTAAALLAQYEDADIPADKQVNVVGVMLEAFQDFSRFGVLDLPDHIYADYHALESESYRGDLVTNIFAGGTVDTERCFLTGYAQLGNFRGQTNSYPWYFRSQGYQTTGMHPCFGWFYNRVNINENLGFQDYFFIENHFKVYSETIPSADVFFFPDLIQDLKQRQSGAPIFSFSVNYQGHGPYPSDVCNWGDPDDILTPDLKAAFSPEAYTIMANYFGSVKDTSHYLLELRDFLAAQDEPYVLVIFGDHNPWMGDGNSVYTAMGLNLDQGTQDGFRNYYATRYLIWANDAAKAVTGNDFVGDGPDLGPCFLMNRVFDLCGWDGPAYMQATNAVAEQVPVQNTSGIYLENGVFTNTLSPEGEALTRDYQWLQYYDKHHFRYRDVD